MPRIQAISNGAVVQVKQVFTNYSGAVRQIHNGYTNYNGALREVFGDLSNIALELNVNGYGPDISVTRTSTANSVKYSVSGAGSNLYRSISVRLFNTRLNPFSSVLPSGLTFKLNVTAKFRSSGSGAGSVGIFLGGEDILFLGASSIGSSVDRYVEKSYGPGSPLHSEEYFDIYASKEGSGTSSIELVVTTATITGTFDGVAYNINLPIHFTGDSGVYN